LQQFGIGWGAQASLSVRQDQTRRARGLGLILVDRLLCQSRPDLSWPLILETSGGAGGSHASPYDSGCISSHPQQNRATLDPNISSAYATALANTRHLDWPRPSFWLEYREWHRLPHAYACSCASA